MSISFCETWEDWHNLALWFSNWLLYVSRCFSYERALLRFLAGVHAMYLVMKACACILFLYSLTSHFSFSFFWSFNIGFNPAHIFQTRVSNTVVYILHTEEQPYEITFRACRMEHLVMFAVVDARISSKPALVCLSWGWQFLHMGKCQAAIYFRRMMLYFLDSMGSTPL